MISLIFLITNMQAITAVFIFLAWVMLWLVLFPYLGALKSSRDKRP
uniref:Uncharacterized protein n=1 Tax=Methylophaga nitratireducenticrescens TaxID=754476 RepID=I1XJH7_METNJ